MIVPYALEDIDYFVKAGSTDIMDVQFDNPENAMLQIDPVWLVLIPTLILFIGIFMGIVWATGRARAQWASKIARAEAEKQIDESRIHQAEIRADEMAMDNTALRVRVEQAERALAAQNARQEEREAALAREREALMEMKAEVEKTFQSLAQGVLRQSQSQFLEIANETFTKHQQGAKGDLSRLIEPVQNSFTEFKKKVEAIERDRAEDRAGLNAQIKAVGESLQQTRDMTGKLAMALSAPKGGGRWGEETLRNVLEIAGLSVHCDFIEQSENETDHGRQRPDVVIRMPGGRELVVDAKVSLEDFLKASEETDLDKRNTFLIAHARNIRNHVQRLAAKDYWKDIEERVDFVAMFIPGENFYSAALEYDRDIFEYAAKNKVIITTPSTLIALAKAVAYGWRQEQAAQNAREAMQIGRQLYDRLGKLAEHMNTVGKRLNGAVDAHNAMTRSLETRVLPSARKLEDLQISEGQAIPSPPQIDSRTNALPLERFISGTGADKD